MRECFLIPSTFGYGERCMTTGAERRYTSTSVSFQLDNEMNDDVMTILVLNLCLSLSLPFIYILRESKKKRHLLKCELGLFI